MYLILCWSYLNHSLGFVGGKKRIKKINRILNRNRNILVKKSQLDYFPKSFSPTLIHTSFLKHTHSCIHRSSSTRSHTHTRTRIHAHTHSLTLTHTYTN